MEYQFGISDKHRQQAALLVILFEESLRVGLTSDEMLEVLREAVERKSVDGGLRYE